MSSKKENIIFIGQKEGGGVITNDYSCHAEQIGTFGLGPCIGVILVQPEKFVACAHFANEKEVKESNILFYWIKKVKNDTGSIKAYLTGEHKGYKDCEGFEDHMSGSEKTVEEIKKIFSEYPELEIFVV